jgi:transcription antitermination factor NusA-like protein
MNQTHYGLDSESKENRYTEFGVNSSQTSMNKDHMMSMGTMQDDNMESSNQQDGKLREGEQASIRALIQSKYVGAIIGIRGATIKSIRETTSTRVSIDTAGGFNAQERILTVSGTVEGVGEAYGMICDKMEKQDLRNDSSIHNAKVFLHLLVAQQQTGALIGKEGANIKNIREMTGAQVSVAQQSLQNSTERAVKVTGTPDNIARAISSIATCLSENPARGVVVPFTGEMFMAPLDPYRNQGMPQYQQQQPAPQHQQHQHNNYDIRGFGGAPITIESTTALPIPDRLIGVIIGKRGSKINQIRQQTGVRINIVEPSGGSSDHQIILTGTPDGCRNAALILKSRMEREMSIMNHYGSK